MHTYIHTYIHPYIHTYMHTYIHTFIHTDRQSRLRTEKTRIRLTMPFVILFLNLHDSYRYDPYRIDAYRNNHGMSSNRLRLNPQKTKFISLGTRQQLAELNLDALSAEFPTMSFSQVVCDLGVLLDSELTFSHHIDQVCRSCYYQLRQLRVIARSLTFNAAVSLVHAFVFSRLDYCSPSSLVSRGFGQRS